MLVGYTYGADNWFCVGCAKDYAEETGESLLDDLFHPIWNYDAVDTPVHCDDCGELLEIPLTREGERYVVEQIAIKLGTIKSTGQFRENSTLAKWLEYYGDQINEWIREEPFVYTDLFIQFFKGEKE